MTQFDTWPAFQEFSFQEFIFPVDRYEEWQEGKIISSGPIHFNIQFKYINNTYFNDKCINVKIENNPMPSKILSNFKFDRAITSGDRILFHIAAERSNIENTSVMLIENILGPTRSFKEFKSNEPILSSVFTINFNIAKISFSFGNPDRLIEFY